MAARFAEPTKVEIVALFEKATPENTKKATEYGVKILNSKFTKMKKFQVIINLKQTLKPFIQMNSGVCFTNWNMTADSEADCFVICQNKWLFDYWDCRNELIANSELRVKRTSTCSLGR